MTVLAFQFQTQNRDIFKFTQIEYLKKGSLLKPYEQTSPAQLTKVCVEEITLTDIKIIESF